MEPNAPNDTNRQPILLNQLAIAASLRSSEDQTLWTGFGAFFAANAILLVALFTTGDFPKKALVAVVIACVGLGVSTVWFWIQRRALGHVERHEALMKTLEEELQIPSRLAVSAEINRELHEKHVPPGPSARRIMTFCSRVGMIGWLLGLLASLVIFAVELARKV